MKALVQHQWHHFQQKHRFVPWREALPRISADIVLVNLSMISAFLCLFTFRVFALPTSDSQELPRRFITYAASHWVFWSLLAIAVFYLNGLYTHSRSYAGRYKALVIFRAVTLFMILFVFSDYLFVRGSLIPRSVLVLAWLFALVTVGGARLGKGIFLKKYRVQPIYSSSEVNRILVVGGAGYLGSELVPKLLDLGHSVRVLDSLLFGSKSLDRVRNHPHFEVISGDVRDIEVVVSAMQDCDAVVHLAAIVGDPACEANRPLTLEVNRAATRMLLDIARGYNVRRFLFASTCSVYGASEFLVDERTKPAPLSLYARTKVDSERLLIESLGPSFHPTVLRLGTLFGLSPRPRFDLVVNLLTARATSAGLITIYNGEQWRPFLHVSDAAEAFALALRASPDIVSGQIFNVGDYNLNHTLREVSEKIARVVPTVEIIHVENTDGRTYRVSFDKIHRQLGFVCTRTLEEGITEIHEVIQSMRITDFGAAEFSNLLVTERFADTDAAQHSSVRILHALAQVAEGEDCITR